MLYAGLVETRCYHCGGEIEPASAVERAQASGTLQFCCNGCATAHEIISGSGAGNYYRFRTDFAPRPDEARNLDIYALEEARLPIDAAGRRSASFLIEGLHCASCVWVNEKVLAAIPGVESAEVHLAAGRVHLTWDAGRANLTDIAAQLARTGYRLAPLDGDASDPDSSWSSRLLRRLAVAGFFAGNIMLISVSLYAGYFDFMDRYTRNFFHLVGLCFAAPVYFYSAGIFFSGAYQALKRGVLSMDLLTSLGLSLAFFYSVYVVFAQSGEVYFDSICFVTFAILIGRYLEFRLRKRSLTVIDNLRSAAPRFARVVKDGVAQLTPIDEIAPGDLIRVAPGDVVPADGRLEDESAETDEAMLTGEFRPAARRRGDLIYSGSRAAGAELNLRVSAKPAESALARIKALAEESLRDTPRMQLIAERLSKWFVAFVLLAAGATYVWWRFVQGDASAAMLNTIALLIVACPCALNLAIPTACIVAVQRAFAAGCVLKQGRALESLARVREIVFDKTGTLSSGRMEVARTHVFRSDYTEERALAVARALESGAGVRHPIAEAFLQLPVHPGAAQIEFSECLYRPGYGVTARSGPATYWLGGPGWLREQLQLEWRPTRAGAAVALMARTPDGGAPELLAAFELEDALRPEAAQAIRELSRHVHASLLSGDLPENAAAAAAALGIQEAHGGVRPEEKRALILEKQKRGEVAMVGDGVNDSIALAAADVGLSFAHGADLALSSADVLLLGRDLGRIPFLFTLARRLRSKIFQNLALAFAYNFALLPLAFLGLLSPFAGALFMAGSSITVVANSMLLGRKVPTPAA